MEFVTAQMAEMRSIVTALPINSAVMMNLIDVYLWNMFAVSEPLLYLMLWTL